MQKVLLEKYTNLQAAFIALDANNDHFIYPNELSEKLLEKEICNETDKHGIFFLFMDKVTKNFRFTSKTQQSLVFRTRTEGSHGRIGTSVFVS